MENEIPVDKEVQKYMDDPNSCPVCGGQDISAGPMEQDGGTTWCNVTCDNCTAEWNDFYTLTGMEIINRGNTENKTKSVNQ